MQRALTIPGLVALVLTTSLARATPNKQVAHEPTGKRAAKQSAAKLEPREKTVRLLVSADANRDGHVSMLELQRLVQKHVLSQVEQRLVRLDRDGDGWVTRAEVPSMQAERFSRFDLNRDGAFTLWELAQFMRKEAAGRSRVLFASLDADQNGVLSMSDVERSDEQRVAEVSPASRQQTRD
jgi:Ca2+-binding EF-hand superfamily protein